MFDLVGPMTLPLPPPEPPPYTRHELGQIADYIRGLVPMHTAIEPVRVPPPLPLATYLVMVR